MCLDMFGYVWVCLDIFGYKNHRVDALHEDVEQIMMPLSVYNCSLVPCHCTLENYSNLQ